MTKYLNERGQWYEGARRHRNRPAEPQKPPLVKGGQGRSGEDLTAAGMFIFWIVFGAATWLLILWSLGLL